MTKQIPPLAYRQTVKNTLPLVQERSHQTESQTLPCLVCAEYSPRQEIDLNRVYEETDAASQRSQNTRPPSGKSGALPLTNKSLLHRFKVGLDFGLCVMKPSDSHEASPWLQVELVRTVFLYLIAWSKCD